MKDFFALFIHELKDAYDCERQIIKALPKMIDAATSSKLKEALQLHLEETEEQLERLEDISEEIKVKLSDAACDGIQGILREGEKVLKLDYQSDVKDAAIIASAQRVEHYEMALYGVLKTYAKLLNFENIEDLLSETLKEEKKADKKLTALAEGSLFSSGINARAKEETVIE